MRHGTLRTGKKNAITSTCLAEPSIRAFQARTGFLAEQWGVTIIVSMLLAVAQVSAVAAEGLRFTEKFGQKVVRFEEDGTPFYDLRDVGIFTAVGQISLTGVDSRRFDEETQISVNIGQFTFSGVLGDDPLYRSGRATASLAHRVFDPPGSRTILRTLRVHLAWSAKQLTVKLTAVTPAFEKSILGSDLVKEPLGAVRRSITGCIHLGEASEKFELETSGRIDAVTVRKGSSIFETGRVQLRGKGRGAGDCGDQIGANGGTAQLPNVASIIFPPGAFPASQAVKIAQTNTAETAADFDVTKVMFSAGARLNYEVRVNSGLLRPNTDVDVVLNIPDAFLAALPTDSELQVFAQMFQDGGSEVLDGFELFQSTFDPIAKTLRSTLPKEAFTNRRSENKSFEAIALISATPTKPVSAVLPSISPLRRRASDTVREFSAHAVDAVITPAPVLGAYIQTDPGSALSPPTCQGSSLGKPFAENFATSSAFQSGKHYGVDYAVPTGTQILSMADGVIENIGMDSRPLKTPDPRSGKLVKGWGQYVVVRHEDGSKTLYAHLGVGTVGHSTGDRISRGDPIALSDNSGGSSGPHLHVEYAPNGKIYAKASKVDPEPCVNAMVRGSITISDNGSLADDAFRVSINGLSVCQTSIGALNTCAIGNLRSGSATLTITAFVAPDDVGTFEITLADDLTFSDASTSRSGTISEGASASFEIVIPATSAQSRLISDGCCGSVRRAGVRGG